MLRIRQPVTRSAERAYVLDVLLGEFLGLEYGAEIEQRGDVEISLAADARRRLILPDVLFAVAPGAWLARESLPARPVARLTVDDRALAERIGERDVRCLYGGIAGPLIRDHGDVVQLGFDLLGSAFFMLTRYEEVAAPVADAHERFPASASLAAEEGFLRRPVVNEYVEVLWWLLQRLWPRLKRRRHTFRVLPTHDVDTPLCAAHTFRAAVRTAAGDIVRRRDAVLAARRLAATAAAKRGSRSLDPCDTFELLMGLSERHGLTSGFFFMGGGSHPAYDGTYSLDEPWVRALLRRIHSRGHELGLHPSYDTFRSSDATRSELETLKRACGEESIEAPLRGGRQHYLRWQNPTTWQIWEDLGFEYDSTLGFADAAGFRCGVCSEYPVFNLTTRCGLTLRERPLVAMDRTVLDYQGLREERALEELLELRRRCRLFDGDFTLLWHNSVLQTRRERRLYTDVLAAR